MATRTQVARYLSQNLDSAKRSQAINQVAAWLIKTHKTRESTYVSKDVARALAEDGYVLAIITTARKIDTSTLKNVETYLRKTCKAAEIELDLSIDPSVIGGIRIETPLGTLDETVKQRLLTILRGNNE